MLAQRIGWMAVALIATVDGLAQKPVPTGTVTGHVVCADTQRPARFAKVSLVRKPSAAEIETIFAPDAPRVPSFEQVTKPGSPVDLMTETTGLDGTYTIRQVPPGDYWVVANLKGYVVPVADALNEKQERDLAGRMKDVPSVHVSAEGTSTADVSLHKGAVVAGRVTYEDGSPGADISVWLSPAGSVKRSEDWSGGYPALERATDYLLWNVHTDDEGRYRLAGIPPGKYVVKIYMTASATVRLLADGTSGSFGPDHETTLTLYAPGVFGRKQAREYEVRGDDVIGDADLKVNLSGLHTVRGRVLAKGDFHAPSRVIVNLVSTTDDSIEFDGAYGPDGTFTADYVPSGTYTIAVDGAYDYTVEPGQPRYKAKVLRWFEGAKVTAVVSDQDLVLDDILLVERKDTDKEKAAEPE